MKYKKKPVIVDAVQIPFGCVLPAELSLFMADCKEDWRCLGAQDDKGQDVLLFTIPTLERNLRAMSGDYIIKGIKGEYYPCRADIFEATYDKVE